MSESAPSPVTRSLPTGTRVALVTALAASASVLVNFALVRLATAFDPTLQRYSHFRLSDYGTLSVVAVICAGMAWYFATRILVAPRHTFFRAAVVTMVLLWMPDVWLLIEHEPTRAVCYLIVMHLAVSLITYNLLVFAAPVRRPVTIVAPVPTWADREVVTTQGRLPRALWMVLAIAVAVDFVSGLIGLLYVPFNRPDGWLAHRGEAIYLVHALLGALLGVAALVVAHHVLRTKVHRVERIAAMSGLCGVVTGAIGGVLCVSHPLRLLGMALMFIGVAVAFFGYLIPLIDDTQAIPFSSTHVTT